MKIIGLEPTNQCSRCCRHCLRNKADPPGLLPLETADLVLTQAAALGFRLVCLTGGEIALYPHLGDLLGLISDRGFDFTLVTSGCRFPDYVLPLLLQPKIKEHLKSVSVSLDGATARTHDGLRGPKSFREAFEALILCRNHQLPFSLKTVITTANRGELTELALLGARHGAGEHGFLYPCPTPNFIREGLLPSPAELEEVFHYIFNNLLGVTSNQITLEGYFLHGAPLNCGNLVEHLNVDYQGKVIFCCMLSHVTEGDGRPAADGGEVLADLKEVPLKAAIVRQFKKAAEVLEARLLGDQTFPGLSPTPCLWCLKYFGKLAWLKDFPDSPWTSWLWPDQADLDRACN